MAAYVVAAAFPAQSILFLLDATGALAPQARFRSTTAGQQHDLASFYLAYNERMHSIWWDVAIRDVLGPVGYLALTVLVVAVCQAAGRGHPRVELLALTTIIGSCAAAASDVMYLSHIAWWRHGGFQATPDIVAFGRASEILDNLGTYVQWAGYIVLAIAFTLVGAVLHAHWFDLHLHRILANLEAASLLLYVLSDYTDFDIGRYIGSVAAGILIGPTLAVLLGRTLPHTEPAARADVPEAEALR